jgi:hypothetical protein
MMRHSPHCYDKITLLAVVACWTVCVLTVTHIGGCGYTSGTTSFPLTQGSRPYSYGRWTPLLPTGAQVQTVTAAKLVLLYVFTQRSLISKLSARPNFDFTNHPLRRSQWARGLRHEPSSPARTLGSWVRITIEAWMSVCVYSVCR